MSLSEHVICSQEQAEGSFVTSSSDIDQLSLWNGIPTPAKSLESEPKKAGSQDCKCGKAMSDCLIHPSTPETWTASMRDSLARILALPENKQAWALRRAVASTVKSYASLAWFDQDSCTWKTSQPSLLTGLQPFSQTLPISGMLANGRLYELPIVGRDTSATVGGYLPDGVNFFHTPVASSSDGGSNSRRALKKRQMSMLPTPTAHDAKKGAYPSEYNRNTPGIAVMLGGKPSPTFQEWQMGWPINHTALKASETDKSLCKPRSRGKSSEVHK